MAKKRKRRKAAKSIKSYARGGGRGGLGNLKPIIDGLIAGGLGQFASKYIGEWGHPAATAGVGIWQNNNTLKTEGARELGALLATKLPFVGGGLPASGRNY